MIISQGMHLGTENSLLVYIIIRRNLQVALKVINIYVCIMDVGNFVHQFLKIVLRGGVGKILVEVCRIVQTLLQFPHHDTCGATQLIYIVSIVTRNKKRNGGHTNDQKRKDA